MEYILVAGVNKRIRCQELLPVRMETQTVMLSPADTPSPLSILIFFICENYSYVEHTLQHAKWVEVSTTPHSHMFSFHSPISLANRFAPAVPLSIQSSHAPTIVRFRKSISLMQSWRLPSGKRCVLVLASCWTQPGDNVS
jgi:hypothetical protein